VGPTGISKLTRCVFETGSQSSFVAKTLIDDVKFEVVDRQDLVVSAIESRSSDSGPCTVALLRKEHVEKYHPTYHCL